MFRLVTRRAPSGEVLVTLALVATSFAFRIPPLVHAASTNSDAAVVGLQAMHMLRGEFSPFLWGSGYQTSSDSLVAAVFFALGGPTPRALMMSSLSLHVSATLFVFASLRRHFSCWSSALAVAPLVLSPSSVHTYALYPPRQLSLTLALAAFYTIGAAIDPRRAGWGVCVVCVGGLLCGLAVSSDPYPLLLVPVALVYSVMLAERSRVGAQVGRFLVGFFVGVLPFVMLHVARRSTTGPMTFAWSGVGDRLRLLVDECLPWALSTRVYVPSRWMDYAAWEPWPFRLLGLVGAGLLVAMVGGTIVLAVAKRGPASLRAMGVAGALVFPLAALAFVFSVMAMDKFAMRYLAVLTLMTPFALAPVLSRLGPARFFCALAPHALASAIGGWVGYGPFVRHGLPVGETSDARNDALLEAALNERGIVFGEADYWVAYRLTFRFRERIILVPTHPSQDRYAPYRTAFEAASTFAYVWDPDRSRETLAEVESTLRSANPERIEAGDLRVFVVRRANFAVVDRASGSANEGSVLRGAHGAGQRDGRRCFASFARDRLHSPSLAQYEFAMSSLHSETVGCPACGGAGGGPFGRAGGLWDDERFVCLRCGGAGVISAGDGLHAVRPGLAKAGADNTDDVEAESTRIRSA